MSNRKGLAKSDLAWMECLQSDTSAVSRRIMAENEWDVNANAGAAAILILAFGGGPCWMTAE